MSDQVLAAIEGAIHDYEISDDAMRHVPDDQRWERLGRTIAPVRFEFTPQQEADFEAAIQRMRDVLNRVGTAMSSFAVSISQFSPQGRRHLAKAFQIPERMLLPSPPQLCIDGHAYHRRQLARRRRR